MYHLQRAWLSLQTWIGAIFFARHPVTGSRKILMLTSGKLGDLVCLTSVFHAIFQQQKITADVVANRFGGELFIGNPAVRKIFSISTVTPQQLKLERYTHAFILNPNPEFVVLTLRAGIPHRVGITTSKEDFWQRQFDRFLTERHEYRCNGQVVEFYQTMLGSIGVQPEPERRELFPASAAVAAARTFWQEHGLVDQWVAGMCLSAGKAYKLWPVDRFARVADYLAEKYHAKILVVGSPADSAYAHALAGMVKHREALVDATGKFTLLELAAAVQPCSLFVSADTGPLHIADTMGVPVVDIAGAADCVTQHPIGKYVIVHPAGKESFGEMAVAFHAGSENEEQYRKMTEAVTIEQVITAIDELLNRNQMLQAKKLQATG